MTHGRLDGITDLKEWSVIEIKDSACLLVIMVIMVIIIHGRIV